MNSLKLFSVRGIDIRVHVTFPLILIWAALQFGWLTGGGVEGAIFGVIVILLLFTIVTLHELGHSAAALRFGVPVKNIVLLPIGGVAQLERIPENPRQELIIAAAGPAVNFGLALILLLVALPFNLPLTDISGLLSGPVTLSLANIFTFIFVQNIFLALFNLIPAFPLDGGRMLRALLAMRLPYARATAVAAAVGRTFAWLLGLYGFLSGGLFLIILAIFVYISAGQEGSQVQLRSILSGIRVEDAFSRQVLTLRPSDPLELAANLTLRSLQSSFPVCEGGRLLGMLTYPRLLETLGSHGRSTPARAVMQTEVPSVTPATPLIEAQALFNSSQLDALPVFENDLFVGMLTNRDVNEMFRLLSAEPELLSLRRSRSTAPLDEVEVTPV